MPTHNAPGTLVAMTLDLSAALQETLNAHGLRADRRDGTVSVAEASLMMFPSIVRVDTHQNCKVVQLDVRVSSPRLSKKVLVESFAGVGVGEMEASKNAFGKFMKSCLHVLVAVLVDARFGEDQVEWDTWNLSGRSSRICLGPLLVHQQLSKNTGASSFDELKSTVSTSYAEFLNGLKVSIPELEAGCHWLRLFLMKNGRERIGSEALLDNLDWPEGRAMVNAWDSPDDTYSVRHFLMVVRP